MKCFVFWRHAWHSKEPFCWLEINGTACWHVHWLCSRLESALQDPNTGCLCWLLSKVEHVLLAPVVDQRKGLNNTKKALNGAVHYVLLGCWLLPVLQLLSNPGRNNVWINHALTRSGSHKAKQIKVFQRTQELWKHCFSLLSVTVDLQTFPSVFQNYI